MCKHEIENFGKLDEIRSLAIRKRTKKKHYQTTSQVTAQANFCQGLIYHKVWPSHA